MLHRRPPTLVDWLVAVAVGLFAIAEEIGGRSMGPSREDLPIWIAAGVVTAAGVLFRRRVPFVILCVYSLVNVLLFALAPQMAAAWQFYTELVLLFTLLTFVGLPASKPSLQVGSLTEFAEGQSPAEQAGFQLGDRIISVDGRAITDWNDIPPQIRASAGRPLPVVIERNGTQLTSGGRRFEHGGGGGGGANGWLYVYAPRTMCFIAPASALPVSTEQVNAQGGICNGM